MLNRPLFPDNAKPALCWCQIWENQAGVNLIMCFRLIICKKNYSQAWLRVREVEATRTYILGLTTEKMHLELPCKMLHPLGCVRSELKQCSVPSETVQWFTVFLWRRRMGMQKKLKSPVSSLSRMESTVLYGPYFTMVDEYSFANPSLGSLSAVVTAVTSDFSCNQTSATQNPLSERNYIEHSVDE